MWKQNDDTLCAFILQHVSTTDVDHAQGCSTTHTLFMCLQMLHENQGAYAQITLFMKALELCLNYDTPLHNTLAEVHNYHYRIIAMGKIKDNDILTALLLHTMSSPEFIHLQQSMQNLTHLPNFNSEMIAKWIHNKDALICWQKELNQPANPNNISLPTQTTFAAQNYMCTCPRLFCSNCKHKSHPMEFCMAPGGKMAGRSVKDARAAYRATFLQTQQ